jgi:DNA-binding NtrC family response regulator
VGNGPLGARAALAIADGLRLEAESGGGRDAGRSDRDQFGRMVGRSTAMQTVFDVLGKASGSEATILLEGETGTGKEVSA